MRRYKVESLRIEDLEIRLAPPTPPTPPLKSVPTPPTPPLKSVPPLKRRKKKISRAEQARLDEESFSVAPKRAQLDDDDALLFFHEVIDDSEF